MTGDSYQLVLGDKNYSSWSLRPWLLMRMFEIPFAEINVDIYNEGARKRVLEHVPSAKVPALKANGLTIWDTLAIIEYLAESHPEHAIWPRDKQARAIARSVSAEMHSGFPSLRTEMPMDMNSDKRVDAVSQDVGRDIARIVEIWRMCRNTYATGGPFLFGEFCAADAMFAPVTSRFKTYGVNVSDFGDDGTGKTYCEAVLGLEQVRNWTSQGHAQMEERGQAY